MAHTSNLHIHLHQSANVLHPLEPLCHDPQLPTFAPSTIFLVEMSPMVPPTSTPLTASLMELSFLVFSNLSSYLYHYWHYRWFHFAPHHFCALRFVLSCSLFTFEPKAPPSSTLFFLSIALLGKFVVAFFLFTSAIYIASLVF